MFNIENRRKIKDIASKMFKRSKAYVVVLWNGDDNEEPVCLFDVVALKDKETITAKVMGKIAAHSAACTRACKELQDQANGELANSELAEKQKSLRSEELAREIQ